ncbi:Nif3-like dinuclear metal center hexameric protein [Bifidobacterium cuniculi]|uniref:GTP cyclohydrolase 1 type 2 homolog n=1 Tax=Bifidobacterium cuniculi TaxID=1688 RepID=A0A087B485_9BIFI|nr:Nif3-like dinuclear metal center hexameric protein [Bifidobacterium cuniculi]KFI65835.1 putative NIF3 family protein [Bifidobacterium cuniculi]
MANLKQVVDILETLYPLRYAEEWDHPGLIVGDLEDSVQSIVFAADPTMDVVQRAVGGGADLLVTHHPLFFRSVHEVSGMGFRGRIVRMLNEVHCGLWVGHTNADAAWRGVGMAAADGFGLVDQTPLQPIADPSYAHPVGLGRVGRLPEPMTLRSFAHVVAEALPATNLGVQVAGDLDAMVETVAVMPGSGDSMFPEINALGVDVYVTSDLRHHPATDELQQAAYEAFLRAKGIMVGHGDAHMRPALINTPHSAIESMWFAYAMHDVPDAVQMATGDRPEVHWDKTNTDPWDMVVGSNATAGRTEGRGIERPA